MGVTVLLDVLVIILFAIIISLVNTIISDTSFNLKYIFILISELAASFFMGWLLGKMLQLILSIKQSRTIKSFLILLSGLGIYLLSNFLRHVGNLYFEIDFYTEPLLVCIIASFYVTNFTRYRREFLKIIHDTVPYVYVAFFTLIGASISLDYLAKAWMIGLVLFIIRLVAISIGAFTGGVIAGDQFRYTKISWMSYVTQAGVSIGLVSVVAGEFPEWGAEFATLMIAIIFINQLVGPPLFKWAIGIAGEDHSQARSNLPAGSQRAIIFGYEAQAMALARQLVDHGWNVKIVTSMKGINEPGIENISVEYCPEINYETLENLEAGKVEAIIALKTDDENLKICELAYENYGTHDLVIRLNNRENFSKFHDLGVKIVEPSTAMVSLLDHFVRSPMATSLLLGMEENQDTVEIVVQNRNLHGIALRDLHLPSDILILSTQRRGQMIISTGFTRLRLGDILTLVGSVESIEEIRLRFE
jgi:Trk K+ transport system NAD-binding subunit